MSPRLYPVISGEALIRKLERTYGYEVVRQKGSHIRIRTYVGGKHSLTIPGHRELDIDTLDGIVAEVARHQGVDRSHVIEKLF